MSTEPWAHVEGFYDEPRFLPPGELVRWQREEAAMRAEEQRVEAERTERAEIRQELALWEARQYSIARGLPWDPQRPFVNLPDIYARAEAAFQLQDREQRDADRRALQEAGLHHLVADLPHPGGLSLSPGESSSPPAAAHGPGPGGSGAATRGVPLMGDPRADRTPAGKARRALRRWRAGERRQRFEMNP
jgi:hypothetical protein